MPPSPNRPQSQSPPVPDSSSRLQSQSPAPASDWQPVPSPREDCLWLGRQEAAAALYRAWRQQVLDGPAASSTAIVSASSPKRALDNGAQEGKSKQRQLARSWRHQPEW